MRIVWKRKQKKGGKNMYKKVNKALLTSLALTQVVGIGLPTVQNVYATSTYIMTAEAQGKLNTVNNSISKMEASPSKDSIKKAISDFSNLFTNKPEDQGDLSLYHDGHADQAFNKINDMILKQSAGTKNELAIHFMNTMGLKYMNEGVGYYYDYLDLLTRNNYDAATEDKILTIAGVINQYIEDKDYLIPNSDGDYAVVDDGQLDLANPNPNTIPDTDIIKPAPPMSLPLDDETEGSPVISGDQPLDSWSDIYYEEVDGKFFRVTTTYTMVDGKIKSTTVRDRVSQSDMFAGTASDWNTLGNTVDAKEIERENEKAEEEMKLQRSNYTLQYTVTNSEKEPYYYDTGIRVAHDKTATYQQVKDVLYQMALRSEGYLIEDKGKFLIVVEGKPVLIKESKERYSKKEMEEMFKSFNDVNVKILSTRIGTTASLEEQLATGKDQKVKLNGKEKELKHYPVVEDGYILLSIQEFASMTGLTYQKDGEKHIIKNGKHSISYEAGVKSVIVNGKVTDVGAPSSLNDSDVLMGDVSPLIETFGFEMIWDEENSTIILTTK